MVTAPRRRAVVTGLGVLSSIGSTPAAFWAALAAGTPGVARIRAFDPTALHCQLAGEVADFNAKAVIEKSYRKTLNAMSRTVQMGVVVSSSPCTTPGWRRGP